MSQSTADTAILMQNVDRQYETYLELANLATLPGVLHSAEAGAEVPAIVPLGLTLLKG